MAEQNGRYVSNNAATLTPIILEKGRFEFSVAKGGFNQISGILDETGSGEQFTLTFHANDETRGGILREKCRELNLNPSGKGKTTTCRITYVEDIWLLLQYLTASNLMPLGRENAVTLMAHVQVAGSLPWRYGDMEPKDLLPAHSVSEALEKNKENMGMLPKGWVSDVEHRCDTLRSRLWSLKAQRESPGSPHKRA